MGAITRDPSRMGGRYCLAGTRMPVADVKQMIADAGREWVKREYPWITDDQISTALNFRHTHKSPAKEGE